MVKSISGERVRELRVKSGLSAESFAAKVGVTRKTVTNWENGASIKSEHIASISDKFKVSSDWILGLTNTDMIRVDNYNETAVDALKLFIDLSRPKNKE